MSSFEHSVLVPLADYNRFKDMIKNKDSPENILLDEKIPSDIKIKLYHKARKQKKDRYDKPPITDKTMKSTVFDTSSPKDLSSKSTSSPKHPSSKSIQTETPLPSISLKDFESKDRNHVEKILTKIKDNPDIVSYNFKKEIIIEGDTIEGSNLTEILHFLLNKSIVTSHTDIPEGARELYNVLLGLDLPPRFFKIKTFDFDPKTKGHQTSAPIRSYHERRPRKRPTGEYQAYDTDSDSFEGEPDFKSKSYRHL